MQWALGRLAGIEGQPDAGRFDRTTSVPLLDDLSPKLALPIAFMVAAQVRAGNIACEARLLHAAEPPAPARSARERRSERLGAGGPSPRQAVGGRGARRSGVRGCDLRRVRLVDHKPLPDADTEALWAGLRRGVLLLRRCLGCSAVHYYQQPRCRACGSEHIEHRAASGYGAVHAFSIVHRAPGPVFRDETPYAVLLVALPEGPRMISRLVGEGAHVLRIGAAVELVCVAVSDEISLPCFRLA